MEDDRSLLAELDINPDAIEPPMGVLASALAAAFDPATPPVEGEVVPVMDDEPHYPADDAGDTIDLGVDETDDASAGSPAAPHSRDHDTDPELALDDDPGPGPETHQANAGEDHDRDHPDFGGHHHDDGPSLDV